MTAQSGFWSVDRTTIKEKPKWFNRLSPVQKFCYVLMLAFLCFWCFYLGITLAHALAPEWAAGALATGDDIVEDEVYEIATLTGMDVILLVGADRRDNQNSFNTDTIMLAFFNWETNDVKLLSIPRDSYVQLPGTSTRTKINATYNMGGVALLCQTIEYTLGIDVDHYVVLDFNGFAKIVDAFGGVEITVPTDMVNQAEGINLSAGPQTLNSEQALGFVRYREPLYADIGRIERQQLFLQAMAGKVEDSSILLKIPQLIQIFWQNCTTDYAVGDGLKIANSVLKTNLNDIYMDTLPGRGMYSSAGINYWYLDEAGVRETLRLFTAGQEPGDLHIYGDSSATVTLPGAQTAPQPEEAELPQADETEQETDGPEAAEPEQPDAEGAEPPQTEDAGAEPQPVDPGGAPDIDLDDLDIPEPPAR